MFRFLNCEALFLLITKDIATTPISDCIGAVLKIIKEERLKKTGKKRFFKRKLRSFLRRKKGLELIFRKVWNSIQTPMKFNDF